MKTKTILLTALLFAGIVIWRFGKGRERKQES